MPNIICRDLSFGYDGSQIQVFNSLNLLIDTGWRTALVGRNGRGKTTLMRLLAGELKPDTGEIERPVSCRMFTGAAQHPQELAWEAARAAAGPFRRWEQELETLAAAADERSLERYGELETAYREAGGYRLDAGLERELDALAIEPDSRRRRFDELSGGEQTRCLLAGLFAVDDGFPLIDEPTNHLDLGGRRLLAEYLAGKQGFLLVSHDRAFLDGSADHLVALNRDTVETHRLSYSEWRGAYLARLDAQSRANELLRKDIRRFEAVADSRRRGAFAREADKGAHMDKGYVGARAARQMKRAIAAERRAEQAAQSRRDALTDMEKSYRLKLKPVPAGVSARTRLVGATDLAILRGRQLFEPISFTVTPGDRLAIVGGNGSGKTSLIDLILGVDVKHRGVLERAGHIRISRVAQLARWRTGSMARHLADSGLDQGSFRQIMAALGVRGELLEVPLEQLSQGQLKKIELARSLSEPAHLYVWDEPLNYIDVDTREQIESLLLEDGLGGGIRPALILVEHDARFLEAISADTVRLEPPADTVMLETDDLSH